MQPVNSAIQWRRLDTSGSESALLAQMANGWRLSGHAVFLEEGNSCGLGYEIICDSDWRTCEVKVFGHIGTDRCEILIESKSGTWSLNGQICPEIEGCIDIDLGFSPSTNLLPIQRLALQNGQKEEVNAAWLRFPEMTLERLKQSYKKETENRYLYESRGGAFKANLEVNSIGFVTHYPDLWSTGTKL